MPTLQYARLNDPQVYEQLRAFSLFWRHGWEVATSVYPEQATFLLLHMDKTFEEVLRACFQQVKHEKVT